jgi:hypothetical protein
MSDLNNSLENLQDEVTMLRAKLLEIEEQNKQIKEALIRWRQREYPGTDQRLIVERDFPFI